MFRRMSVVLAMNRRAVMRFSKILSASETQSTKNRKETQSENPLDPPISELDISRMGADVPGRH